MLFFFMGTSSATVDAATRQLVTVGRGGGDSIGTGLRRWRPKPKRDDPKTAALAILLLLDEWGL